MYAIGRITKYMTCYICNLYIACMFAVRYTTSVEGGDMMTLTEAQAKANKKYLQTLKSISFRVKPDIYDRYKAAAERAGKPLRAYILEEKIAREG